MAEQVNALQAYRLMKKSSSKFFSLEFIKRTTGEPRTMVCRLGVTKGLKGGKLKFDPIEKDLLPVYDMQAKGFRSISLDSINWVKVGGVTYNVIN